VSEVAGSQIPGGLCERQTPFADANSERRFAKGIEPGTFSRACGFPEPNNSTASGAWLRQPLECARIESSANGSEKAAKREQELANGDPASCD
jgi:hypothetical protein